MGQVRHGVAGGEWCGEALRGEARLGVAGCGRHGEAGSGKVWHGMSGHGQAWFGEEDSMKYQWKKNSTGAKSVPFGRVDAEVVGATLADLQKRQQLKPAVVINEARPVDSPLHPLFEWNDSIAGERWRTEQARSIIANVLIVDGAHSEASAPIRAFVSLNPDGDYDGDNSEYLPIATVIADPDLYAQMCRRAHKDLEGFEERYSEFVELKQIGSEAKERVKAQLERLQGNAVAV